MILCAALAAGGFCYLLIEKKSHYPVPPADSIQVTATELNAAYARNAIAAERDYGGRKLAVTGAVHAVARSPFGKPYVVLRIENDAVSQVICNFGPDEEAELGMLKPGDNVMIVGNCGERIAMIISLRECRLWK